LTGRRGRPWWQVTGKPFAFAQVPLETQKRMKAPRRGRPVTAAPEGLVKFIGVAEVSGALGVILPAATRIRPLLTPLAAVGFGVIMVLASGLHLSLGQPPILQVILGGLAAFVAWGRLCKAPIAPRG
jgi:hypothetical protein